MSYITISTNYNNNNNYYYYFYYYNFPLVSGEEVGCELKLRGVFSKHNSVVSHLDLSSDGRFLQVSLYGIIAVLACA